jgi:hypothetical protein
MIPITISGLGVREGVLIYLLKPYGIAGEEAFALSIMIFLATIMLVGISGGIYDVSKTILAVTKRRHAETR